MTQDTGTRNEQRATAEDSTSGVGPFCTMVEHTVFSNLVERNKINMIRRMSTVNVSIECGEKEGDVQLTSMKGGSFSSEVIWDLKYPVNMS